MTLLRRAVAMVAIAVGIGVTAGTASAAAAAPTHQAKTPQVTSIGSHRAAPVPLDWWWL